MSGRRVPSDPAMSPLPLVAAFLRRDFTIARSYRVPFVLDLVQRLSSLVLFFFLGRLVDSRTKPGSGDFHGGYFGFVLIGIVLLGIITTTLSAFSERLRTDQTTGTLETVLAMPSPTWLTILGSASYDLVYASAVALATFALALAGFGLRLSTSPAAIAVAVVALTAAIALFSAIGVALAAFVVLFKRGNALMGLLGSGLALLGGVYYPVRLLPGPLHLLAQALPFTWAVDVLRQALLADQVPLVGLARLVAAAAVAVPLGLWVFSVAVRRARQQGTLTQF
jgi:ABC-2 type transport system permease protein